MNFKGLPIPGAAGALISVMLLNKKVIPTLDPWLAGTSEVMAKIIPWLAIALGLLMVSRLPYVHMVNRFLRGKKPFWVLVTAVLSILVFLLWPHVVLTIGLCGYAASGPVLWLMTMGKRRKESLATNDTNGHE
jgi:CDP-diacylglycerol--serine O-phosphatidyltransferase